MKFQKATEGENYTMKKIFRDQIKFFKGESLSAQEIIDEAEE